MERKLTDEQRAQGRRERLAKVRTPESQSKRRLAQLVNEEAIANELRKDGWEIFSPTVVCDRVGVKNGKVYFVEFKKPGQQLRDGQERIRSLVPRRYLILYR